MTPDVNPPRRRYDVSGRTARAQRTREEITDAARRLFEDRGYAPTKIVEVAREASVSPETIYKAFGSKAGLLRAALTASIRADTDATPLRQRPVIDAIRQEPDARRQLKLYAELLADVNSRLAGLARVMREAATSDPEIAAALAQLKEDRLDGMSEFAALLTDRGALRDGISEEEARDVLWTLNSPELYELLVLDRGWTPTQYGRWIAHALTAALLD
jgi:AcrR family transcriptional regulator